MSDLTEIKVTAFEKDGKHYIVDPEAPDRVAQFRALWGDSFDDLSDEECDKLIQEPVGTPNITVSRWTTLPTAAFRRL